MAENSRVESLQSEMSELRRQLDVLGDRVASLGRSMPGGAQLRAAGRRVAGYGDEAGRTVRRHPIASGAVALAVLGAAVGLVLWAGQRRDED